MHAKFADKKSIFMIDGPPESGRFALDSEAPKQPSWEGCREQFASKIDETTPGFFFSHRCWQTDNVAGFMTKSEEILNLPEKSIYSRTDKDIILWIEPARFWMGCWMKRSLLTILLRCGMYYDPDKDNFEDALFGEKAAPVGFLPDIYNDKAREYALMTKPAVMRFMFGFTKFVMPPDVSVPTGNLHKNLWVEVFKTRSVKELKTILVAEDPQPEFGLLGLDAIWA